MAALEAERALAPEGFDVVLASSYPRSATYWLFELGQVSCTLQVTDTPYQQSGVKLRPLFR